MIADEPASWPVVSRRDLHRDDWVMALRSDTVTLPGSDDEPFERLVFEHPGAVIILALDDHERALVLQQYRHPVQQRLVELPAGLRDAEGEEPVTTAQRELREEAQLAADHWEPLISAWGSPGVSTELFDVYLATGLHAVDRGDFQLEHEEAEMDRSWIGIDDLIDGVMDGRVRDAAAVVAILAYAERRRRTVGN